MHNRLSAIAIIWCLIITASCKNETPPSVDDIAIEVPIVEMACDDLSALSIIHADNKRVITNTGQSVGLCAIYDIRNDSLILSSRILNQGNGPTEVSAPVFHVKNDTMYVVNVLSRGSILKDFWAIPLNTAADTGTWEQSSLEWANPYQMMNAFVVLNDGSILATGGMVGTKTALSIIDTKSHEVISLDYWPEDKFSGPDIIKKYVYSSNASLNTNGEMLCYSCLYGGYIETFTISEGKLANRSTVMNAVPKYTEGNDGFHPSFANPEDGRFRYVTTSENHIYVLQIPPFTGKPSIDGIPWYCTNCFDRYTWDGTHEGTYISIDYFNKVFPSPDNSTVIALCNEKGSGEEHISRFIIE